MADTAVTIESPGKVNLLLNVLRKRPDGFHDIHSLMTTVGLCDTITVTATADPGIAITCNDPAVPCDERNLVHQAATRLRATIRQRAAEGLDAGTPSPAGCRIDLTKRIPVGGGMGGGSSNLAQVLLTLNGLWGGNIAPDDLRNLAGEIGSDAPFFFGGGTSITSCTGTVCTDVSMRWRGWLVLASAGLLVSTAEIYRRCRPLERDDLQRRTERLLEATDASSLARFLQNDLEEPVLAHAPEVALLKQVLLDAGARVAMVSGAGSTLFEPFDERDAAEQFAARIRERQPRKKVWIVEAPFQATRRAGC